MAALACGDDESGASASGTGSSGDGGGNAAGGNAGSGNAAGGNTGSGNAGGGNAAGGNAGSGNTGGGNAGGGGGTAGACVAALLVKGSNYATDPHDLSIPLADLEAGVTKTYESTGSNHTHDVELTAEDFTALRNGETVKKYTCLGPANFTDHEWVFSCADPDIMPTFEGEIGTPGNCPG